MATFTRLTGNAVIIGTATADLITTGAGNDLILAGGGANTISAGDGANLISAGAGDDDITTGSGNDTILAGAGNNRIRAGAGVNTIVTGSGNDNITSGNGNDFIDAGAGNNLINAGGGVNNITTGGGNDNITSGSGSDTINAGGGTNVVNAGDGANTVNTGAGNDTVTTGAGNDNINSGDGVNTVTSGAGNDVITTGAGTDTLDAGRGSDVVRSGAGNDVILHRIAENLGFVDQYDGGGGQDSLRLDLSSAEWARADVQADVAAFLARTNPAATFRFTSTNLTVVNVERLEVFVEGVRLTNPANEAVSAVADSLSITDGSSVSSINLLLNDGVPDRATSVTLLDISPLEVSTLGASTLGTATLVTSLDGAVQTATLNFVPDASLRSLAQGQSLSETLQYRVQDVNGDFSIGNVTITVTGTNDAPVALDDAAITREGTSVAIAVLGNDSDPERDPLTITQVADRLIAVGSPVTLNDPITNAPVGQVALAPAGVLVFTPAPGFSGPVEFTYTVSDGSATDQGLVKISVDTVNNAPAGKDAVATTLEDTPYTLTVANFGFTDPDAGDTLKAVRIDSLPGNGVLQLSGAPLVAGTLVTAALIAAGALKFVPDANENGLPYASFTFSVQDQSNTFDPVPNTFILNVEQVSDTPAAGDDQARTPEDTPVRIDVLANDVDADAGVLRITAVNGMPVSVGGMPVTVIGAGGLPIGTVALVFDNGKPVLEFTPAKDYNGPANFNYTVTDGLTPVIANVAVTVTPVNDPPVANPDNVTTVEDTPVVITVLRNDTDVDGDPLTVDSFTQPSNGTLTLDPAGAFTYVPLPNFNGTDTFTYVVKDPSGVTSTTTVTVKVGDDNDAPAAVDDSGTTQEGSPITVSVLANDTDVDGDRLTVTQVNGQPISRAQGVDLFDNATVPNKIGTVTLEPTGAVTFTPVPLFNGPVEFTYTVSDGAATDQGLVKISVDAVNNPPDARDDLITGNEDTTLTFRPEANDNDVDGPPPRITAINGIPIELRDPPIQLTNGIVYKVPAVPLGSTKLQFLPNANFNGEQTFEYTISDGRGGTDTAIVTIQLAPANDAPAGGDAAATVTEGDAYTLKASDFGFADPDVGDSLKAVRIDSLATNGTLQLDGSPVTAQTLVMAEQIAAGALKFVPDAGENGSPYGSFRFSLQDQSNAFDPVPNTFTLNVIGGLTVNSVPVNEGDIATFTVGIPGSAQPTLIKLAVSTADPRFTAEDADLASPGFLVVSVASPAGSAITLTPAADGSYTVPAGVTSVQVGVPTVQDQVYEGPESFGLTVTSTSPTVSNGTVGVTAEGIINDQQGPGSDLPIIGISVTPGPVNEEGPAALVYTVAITNGKTSEFPTVVNYTVGGSALEGVDFLAPTRSVSIPAGQTSASFSVTPVDDAVFEGRETVVVTLQSATSNGQSLPLAGTAVAATGSIDDSSGPGSDKPTLGITVSPALVQEDGPANLVYTVAITNGKISNQPIEVSFALTGTATAGADYAPVFRTLMIPPGATSATFVVDPIGDTAYEGNETVVATLVSASTAGVPLGLDPARTAAIGTIVDNDLPSQGTVPTAQEAALSTGSSPALTTELVTGRMAGSDAANPNFSWRLGAPPAGIIKSGGANVLWATSADGKLVTGTVTDTVNGVPTVKPITTLSINDAGEYSFSLQGPVDHLAGGAPNQALAINFSVTASSGGAGAVTVPLTINVQDDQPGTPTPPTDLTSTIANTNLMFILDLSGSMNSSSGIGTLTRLQAAVDSVSRLIEKYDALGETTVRLVTFNNSATARDGVGFTNLFLNLGDAAQKTALTNLLASIRNNPPPGSANTNYDAALGTAITAWEAGGKIVGAQNVSYFLSDGLPTAYSGTTSQLLTPGNPGQFTVDTGGARDADTGIQPVEEQLWIDFLTSRNLQSYAVGIGTGIAGGAADLATVAYDGQAEENRNGQIVTDLTQLDAVLNDTLPKSIQGKLVGSLTTGGAGADGGAYLKSIAIGGVTYTFTPDASGVGGSLSGLLSNGSSFDPATASLTVASTASVGARLVIDFDGGSYSFDSPAVLGTETIVYTVADRDGDVSPPASLQIQVDAATASVIGDDVGNQLTGDARVNTVFGKGGDDVLLGVGGNDRLFGNAGNDNLDGGAGNDELSGGAGTDQVLGGPGNDFIAGGAGNDNLSGGIGSDVFAWRFADQGTPGAGRALDTVADFSVAPVAQGGDVLDLRDLLIGEAQGVNSSAGNLQSFLDIVVVGGNTEIRVSTAGGFTGGNYGTGAAEDQRITLTGVNLSTALVPGLVLSEAQLIENLLRNGKLITD